ncbi:transglycosylase SLT domain-containing protein [Schlegelella aquatica]|uniref:transglycosylase SLT domain-containing protein n=1 Tax=Caldimonas aquatica TaxID=376175 RepID=UPI0037521941
MTAFESLCRSLKSVRNATVASVTVFVKDVGRGLLEISHNGLAMIGLVVIAAGAFGLTQPELRHELETRTLGWLQARHEARLEQSPDGLLTLLAEPAAIQRATAADPRELSKQQAAVATWLARRYRVAPEPVARLVQEAWNVGQRAGVDPTLILAIMAIESGFNPFAQSSVGAQGLMQVMTRVHDEKYEPFGGVHAAFDPIANLRVGVQVLKECIARAGSLEGGLRYYVGAANLDTDGGYVGKVLSEQTYLKRVAAGQKVPIFAPQLLQAAQPAAPEAAASAVPAVDAGPTKNVERVAWAQ